MDDIKTFANYIYSTLGPGHSERIYHNAMEVILRKNNIQYETERIVPILFEGHTIGNMRADLIIDNKLIVELKSAKSLNNVMKQQALNYLKLTGIPRGLLINFPQIQSGTCEILEVDTSVETVL
jgi:GxxExxY protein